MPLGLRGHAPDARSFCHVVPTRCRAQWPASVVRAAPSDAPGLVPSNVPVGTSCALRDCQDKRNPIPLLELLNPARRGHPGPLVNVTAANHFWHLLPRNDPVAAQRALSEALADLATPEPSQSRSAPCLARDRPTRPKPGRRAAGRLRHGRGAAAPIGCLAIGLRPVPVVRAGVRTCAAVPPRRQAFPRAAGLHDRPFCCVCSSTGKSNSCCGRSSASSLSPMAGSNSTRPISMPNPLGLLNQPLVSRRNDEARGEESTLEREYIHLLLMESAERRPAVALRRVLGEPTDSALAQRAVAAIGQDARRAGRAHRTSLCRRSRQRRRDSCGRQGRRRVRSRYLDPAPMLALIKDEIASLRDPADPLDHSAPIRRGRQLKLLRKVYAILPAESGADQSSRRSPACRVDGQSASWACPISHGCCVTRSASEPGGVIARAKSERRHGRHGRTLDFVRQQRAPEAT